MTDIDEPTLASDVDLETDATEEELKRRQVAKAVQVRKVKREALKKAGADEAPGSPDLYERLERKRAEGEHQRLAERTAKRVGGKKLTPAQAAQKAVDRKLLKIRPGKK